MEWRAEGREDSKQWCSSQELKKYYKILILSGRPFGGEGGIFEMQKDTA